MDAPRVTKRERDRLIRGLSLGGYVRDGRVMMRDEGGDYVTPLVDIILARMHEMGIVDIRDAIDAFGGGKLTALPGRRDEFA